MSDTKTISAGQIGRSLPRAEARAKVTGRAEYVHNLRLPGMLWAKIARSTVPHGRIRHIDTSAAQATHGVYSVVTGDDILRVIPDPYFGPAFHDQPILALGKVRYAGEPVAEVKSCVPPGRRQRFFQDLRCVFDATGYQHAATVDKPRKCQLARLGRY